MILYKIVSKINDLLLCKKTRGGIVSITFDDQWHSAYSNALPVLEYHDFKSTWYVCVNSIGKYDEEYRERSIDWEEVNNLLDLNHEIGSHTNTHCDFDCTDINKIKNELVSSKATLFEKTGRLATSFAYPYTRIGRNVGGPRETLLRYDSARGGDFGLNRYPLRRDNLFSCKMYQNKHSLDYLKALVDICVIQNEWLIFYTHDVKADHSDYGCSPVFFEQLMGYIKDKRVKVETVGKVIDRLF